MRPPWYWLFNVKDEEVLREIAVTILRLYSRRPPDREQLEKRCNELREQFNKTQEALSSQSPAQPGGEASPLISQLKGAKFFCTSTIALLLCTELLIHVVKLSIILIRV